MLPSHLNSGWTVFQCGSPPLHKRPLSWWFWVTMAMWHHCHSQDYPNLPDLCFYQLWISWQVTVLVQSSVAVFTPFTPNLSIPICKTFFDWIFNFDLKYSMSKIPFRNIQVTKSTIPIPFLNKLVPLLSPGNIAASQPTKGNLLCSLNIVNMISVPIRRHGLSPSSEIHALLLITLDILHLYVFGFAHHK